MKRCSWGQTPEIYKKYHDEEWGVPCHDDKKLFEMLILEGAQAGLSWLTILKRRNTYREAFDNFDADKIFKYDENDFQRLMNDPGIIRNKLKIRATIKAAHLFLEIQKEFGSFDKYIWQFVGNKTIVNKFKTMQDIPATSKESDLMSKDLKLRGFSFVGSTICYAYMQAVGMVNDHLVDCFRCRV
jgi:DNA-3-methyladenine glycosylase I